VDHAEEKAVRKGCTKPTQKQVLITKCLKTHREKNGHPKRMQKKKTGVRKKKDIKQKERLLERQAYKPRDSKVGRRKI